MKRRMIALLALLLCPLMLLPGCKKKPKEGTTQGDLAPAFEITLVGGEKFSSDICKGKVTLLYFFSKQSDGSVTLLEAIRKLQDTFDGKDVVILPINLFESAEDCKKLLGESVFTDGVGLDSLTNGKVFKSYAVQYLPGAFLIDRDGVIVDRRYGSNETENYIAYYTEKIQTILEAEQ